MKKRIDFLKRDVKQNRNKFIAVVLITALAVGFLTGLISIAPDMEYTADKYYDDRDFWDLKINSTLGFTEEDIETIKNQKYVESASGVISLEVNSSLGGEGDYATLLYAVDFDNDIASGEMLSSPILSEGSYPINTTSCVVLESAALKNDIKIGDKIYLNSGGNILSEVAFTVTGIADAPEFASTQKQSGLSGEKQIEMVMYVSRQVYPAQSIYTDVYVKVKGTKELNAFSHKYDDAIKTAKTKLTALSKEREKVRDEYITGQHQALLGQATDDYKQHEAGIRTQLAAQKKYINSLKKGIEKSEEDIEKREAKLATQKANLDIQAPTIEALKALGDAATVEQKATIKKYNEALKKYNKSVKDLDKKVNSLKVDKSIYEQAKKSYDKNLRQANKELANAQNQLEGYKGQEQENGKQSWLINDRTSNASFMSVKADTEKIRATAKTVPVIFVLVAVAVILLLIFYFYSRRQNENGVLKSLGYSDKVIVKKNTLFAVWAVAIGSLIGLVLGVLILPLLSYKIFENINNYGPIRILFVPSAVVFCAVIFIGVSLAAYYICRYFAKGKTADLIKQNSNLLTSKKAPLKIESALESLNPKVKSMIIYLLKNRVRLCINVLGVLCCTVLLLSSIGLRGAVHNTTERQFNDIQHYDAEVYVKTDVDLEKSESFKKVLSNKNQVSASLGVRGEGFTALADNAKVTVLVVPQKSKIADFVTLKSNNRKDIEINKNSVIIGENFAKANNIKSGGTLKLVARSGDIKSFKVTAVCENYVGNTVYISPDVYKKVMGADFAVNRYLLKLAQGADKQALEVAAKNTGIIEGITYNEDLKLDTELLLQGFGGVTLLVSLCCLIISIVVACMLTHINISLQKDKLTYDLLNGITNQHKKELIAEGIVTVGAGLLLGALIGWGITFLTTSMLSTADIMFIKNVNIASVLIAVGLVLAVLSAVIYSQLLLFKNSCIKK